MKAVKILTPTFIALLVETPRMQKTKKKCWINDISTQQVIMDC